MRYAIFVVQIKVSKKVQSSEHNNLKFLSVAWKPYLVQKVKTVYGSKSGMKLLKVRKRSEKFLLQINELHTPNNTK